VTGVPAAAVEQKPTEKVKRPSTFGPTPSPDAPAAGRARGERPFDPGDNRVALPEGAYILVVDDEPIVRRLLGAQLDHLGYPHRTVPGGEQALTTLRRHPGAVLVFTDVQMPQISGIELLGEIKRIDANIQVVMISGHQDLETMRACLQRGACDYLVKPYELDELSLMIARALNRRGQERDEEPRC
jgi:DNA-binding NtrC family response regulator